jgi:hypothetical protein
VRTSRLALALTVGFAACGSSKAPAPPPTPTAAPLAPVLCRAPLPVREVGRVDTPAATELSGLVLAPDGTLWTHNDSGDVPRLFRLTRRGALKREVPVPGATAVDWEDIAIRGRTLYIGDIGDNFANRPEIDVYRFKPGRPAAKLALHYEDQPHDAEALLVDPKDGTIVIVTKSYEGLARVYVAHGQTLRKAGTIDLGIGEPVTAGDVSADGRTIVLRTYDKAFVWTRKRGSLAAALQRKPCTVKNSLAAEGQGEALALTRDGRAFYTVPEGATPPLRRYGG